MNSIKNRGFTLVELIIVIVILGILAAYVTSRFSSLDTEARKSMMKTLYTSVKSASSGVHGQAVVTNASGQQDANVNVEGKTVKIQYGYAAANEDGIVKALDQSAIGEKGDISVETRDNIVVFQHKAARSGENCQVTYKYLGDGSYPEVEMNVDNCQ